MSAYAYIPKTPAFPPPGIRFAPFAASLRVMPPLPSPLPPPSSLAKAAASSSLPRSVLASSSTAPTTSSAPSPLPRRVLAAASKAHTPRIRFIDLYRCTVQEEKTLAGFNLGDQVSMRYWKTSQTTDTCVAKILAAWRVIDTEAKTQDIKVGDILVEIHYIYSFAHVTECEPHIKPKHLKAIGMGPNDLAFARHHVDFVPLECVLSLAHQPVRFEVLLPLSLGNRKSPVHVQPIQGPAQ